MHVCLHKESEIKTQETRKEEEQGGQACGFDYSLRKTGLDF